MFKNVASQKLTVYVFDSTTNLPKTGDAANLTAYRDLDDGGVTVLGDTTATEKDATNAKGYYIFDLTQAETNGDKILFSVKSSTANMVCLAMPAVVYTTPPNFTATSVDSNGRVDVIKVAGTTQTAKDIGGAVPAVAAGASGGLLISGSNTGTTTLGALTVTGVTTHTGNVVLSDGLTISAPSTANRNGVTVTANGTGHGISVTNGSGGGGNALHLVAVTANGIGLNAVGVGTGAGIVATGGNSAGGDGILATGGSNGNGISANSGFTAGAGFKAIGNTGNGITATGAGANAGIAITGGATGIGLSVTGGATSGDGIKVVTTSGHGVNLAPVGTSKHGLFVTGGNGGTSDGVSAVAGTGGVPIRGNITGNITGTIDTVTTATNVTTVNGLAANVVTAASINADAITAAKIANAAIDQATFASDVPSLAMRTGTAQAGAATSITLDSGASASNNFYNNTLIFITGGTGIGQSRFITAYVGATKVATVATWVTNPDNTSTFAILPFDAVAGASAPTVAQIATGVWQDATAGDFTAANSVGKSVMNGVSLGTGLTIAAVSGAVGSVTGAVGSVTGAVGSVTGAVGSVTGAVGSVTGAVGSVTGMTASDVGAIKAKTDNLPAAPASTTNISAGTITTVTNLTNAPTAGDLTATMKTSVTTAASAATPALSAAGNNAVADALLARTLGTEAVSADNAVPTVQQAVFEILSLLGEFSISGTTITCKKRDGTTTLFTSTLDSATTPTSRTRAT